MRFVDCGTEPVSLQRLAQHDAAGQPIWNPSGKDGSDFFRDLGRPFDYLCGYCERPCDLNQGGKQNSNEVDHFRPRSLFPELTFAWENLVYVCRRCNQAKGNQFPGKNPMPDLAINALNSEAHSYGKQFVDPLEDDGYVNPRDARERAETFFVFNSSGEILPNPNLDDQRWSKARRTIRDFDLNPVGGPGATNLCELRREAFKTVSALALFLSSTRTRRAARLNQALQQPVPGFPSFLAWALDNALHQR